MCPRNTGRNVRTCHRAKRRPLETWVWVRLWGKSSARAVYGSKISRPSCPHPHPRLEDPVEVNKLEVHRTRRSLGSAGLLPVARITLAHLPGTRWSDTPEVSPAMFRLASSRRRHHRSIEGRSFVFANLSSRMPLLFRATRLSTPLLSFLAVHLPSARQAIQRHATTDKAIPAFPSSRMAFRWGGAGDPAEGTPAPTARRPVVPHRPLPPPRSPETWSYDDRPEATHHKSYLRALVEIQ